MNVHNELIAALALAVTIFLLLGWHIRGWVQFLAGRDEAREYWKSLHPRLRGQTDPGYTPRHIEQSPPAVRHGFTDELQRLAREWRS